VVERHGPLQDNVDLQFREGFLKTRFEGGKYVDLSLIKEAATRISAP
jgi:hypothetical protein